MGEQKKWVWYGDGVSEHDQNNWSFLKQLLQQRPLEGEEIIEVKSEAELMQLGQQLQIEGWEVDEEATESLPRLTCWKKTVP